MNPSSTNNRSDCLPSESSPTSSNSGTDQDGSERSTCGSDSTADNCSALSPESSQSRQTSFDDCEIYARTSKESSGISPASIDQLHLEIAPAGKRCYSCRRLLPIEVFARMRYKNKPGVEFRNPRCNQCRAAREKGTPAVRRRRALFDAARNVPCTDCGQRFPLVCMDLDHVHGKKEFNIGSGYRCKSDEALIAEIAKCEPVCSNCHRIRTETRHTLKGSRRGRPPKFLAKSPSELSEVQPGPKSLWRTSRKSAN